MTVDCLWELEKVVFTALNGDGTISGLVNGIYSHIPQGTLYPYIKINALEATNWSTKTTVGIRCGISVDVYSDERGSKEIHDILIEVKRVLNGASLSMTGCSMVNSNYVSTSVSTMPDGLTWRGQSRFNFLVQKD